MDIRLSAAAPIAFGRHAFDPWRGELRTAGARPIALGACAVRVLQTLIAAAGQVLTPAQLTERAWPGRAIHPSNVRVQIAALRRALAGDRDLIGTVSGAGYVFTGRLARAGTPALLGRAALLAAVATRLEAGPIVTLTGPAGIGKSALAQAVARRTAIARRACVAVDRLGEASERALLAAVATALGVPGATSLPALAAALPHAPLLLVLDNCDHAMDAASRLAEGLARQRPALRILATSRQTLRADAEAVVRVPPLAPDDATHLLLAQAYGGSGALAPTAWQAATQACRWLDGVPLALVLAAAQVRAQRRSGPCAMLACQRRLAAAPPVDLALAVVPADGTLAARHRSLRAASAWSEPLLPAHARQALGLLAPLSGWFALDDAVALLRAHGGDRADPVDSLAVLAAHSSLLADTTVAPARYRMALAARA
ncbi:winged helix-turn-helix domain-containing protein [Pseudoduganella chitinolytica]|uniref:Winged helix-turn-helix domain-containing protein n=1 Tax=Pseudoduganella chitinolytica TaxID=34070 RepID=A0ABY8BDB4_9BURK|nr:winged helix-turn-helix domain-containing protein [Pseudoduganella chitinolytica]WEF33902.1 winged helix-turn-helix domain-containing protein [Pseudoduganella chitinolytica]